jgi:hypothetical protein
LTELHQRWAALQSEFSRLNVEMMNAEDAARIGAPRARHFTNSGWSQDFYTEAEVEAAAGLTDCEQLAEWRAVIANVAAKGGIDAVAEERERVGAELSSVVDAILAAPIRSAEDVAVFLDLMMEYQWSSLDLVDKGKARMPWLCALIRRLQESAPAVELAALRRMFQTDHERKVIFHKPLELHPD